MRTIILILLTPMIASANWFPVGKGGAKTVYVDKVKCEQAETATCYDITGKDLRYHELQTAEVDDLSKPIWKTRYNVDACADTAECQTQLSTKVCDDEEGDGAQYAENDLMPGYSSFCTRLLGYEKKNEIKLVLNETTQASVIAQDLAKQTEGDAVAQIKAAMECGKTVKAVMAIRNVQKGLTPAQITTFVQTYATVSALLDAGALVTAKAEVEALTPDGTLTTAEDKTAIVAQLNKCLGL